ncbi:SapC family protein [Ectothiorhodospira haloalkaliphila]|uniref:SapC family protein n=1 Tax=Ectothiorhodospira haloalkaliphila TaxID=421628 RepID=UPI001EE8F548|nr:SapC family protein [Ectothiorhodospira haloalkaliphila]MCG5526490.1 SapC family protein [Ectothiorhodospira haloalkaliphila]
MSRYIPLSPQRFNDLRWQRFRDYRHAAGFHLMPVAAPEASAAAAHLPLAFIRDPEGKGSLCALLGLREGENHCLDAKHAWQVGYTPALLRSHPFRLLPPPKGQGEPHQRVLCVDMESPWVGPEGDQAFLEDGQMTMAVKEIFEFLGGLTQHLLRTEQAVAALDEAKLLTAWKLEDEQGQVIKGLRRVDEARLNKLDPSTLAVLHAKGSLALAYAQLISTHQWPALKARALRTRQPAPKDDLSKFFPDHTGLQFDFDR